MKRTIDLALSLVLAVLALPLMVLTALLVVLEDGRPILYRQERVGENGRAFTLSKFRSMRKDAETGRHADLGHATATTASPASAASSARPGSTSCRSCGTCCAAT